MGETIARTVTSTPATKRGIRVHGASDARRRCSRSQPWRKSATAAIPPPITSGWSDQARQRFSVASTALTESG
jgi:hypothetical protein